MGLGEYTYIFVLAYSEQLAPEGEAPVGHGHPEVRDGPPLADGHHLNADVRE